MSFSQVLCEERTSMCIGDHSKLTPASQLVGPDNDSASWTLKQKCSQPILSVHAFESFSFYWTTQCSLRIAASHMLSHSLNKGKHRWIPAPQSSNFSENSSYIHTYQFVWMFTRCCCFEWEHFKTQIIYQLNTIQGSFKAICPKFVIINVQGSCRKLYNCKAFQKTFWCWYPGCLIQKQREIVVLLATALQTQILAFLNNHF